MNISWDEKNLPLAWRLLASISLSAFFYIVYTPTMYLASLAPRPIAPHYKWEAAIPLIPVTIIPYWSINFFFLAGPLLCKTRRELAGISMRIVAAITVAGICFALFPLTLLWPRVTSAGVFQPLFNALYTFDKPHNLAPSLHISLIAMLWPIYTRHTRGPLRILIHFWLALIFISVFTTHQHHLIDVVTACALAVLCWYTFPDNLRPSPPIRPSWRIVWPYWLGTFLCLALSILLYHHSRYFWIPLWPAISLLAIGAAYAGVGGWIYRKNRGRIPWSTRIVLGPVLVGTFLYHSLHRRQITKFHAITDHIILGCWLTDRQAAALIAHGVTAVLDMTAEYTEARPFREKTVYKNIPILDYTALSRENLNAAVAFVLEHSQRGVVYVHCAMGYSRSVAITAAALVRSSRAPSVSAAIEQIRQRRPGIRISPELVASCSEFTL